MNALRNVAINNLDTSFVFMIDIDMIPNQGLRNQFINHDTSMLGARADRSRGTYNTCRKKKTLVKLPLTVFE